MIPHNPDNLTHIQIGTAEGWRLLDEDEIGSLPPITYYCIQIWSHGAWAVGAHRDTTGHPCRTKLTRAELRKARGLEPETDVPPESRASDTPRTDETEAMLRSNGWNTEFTPLVAVLVKARDIERELTLANATIAELRNDKELLDTLETMDSWIGVFGEYNIEARFYAGKSYPTTVRSAAAEAMKGDK